MGTESDGFPDEPTFNLAALAGQEQLQERIRTLENERDGKVLADPCERCNGSGSEPDTDPDEAAGLVLVAREDVKWVLAAISCYMPLGMVDEEQHAVLARLRDASGASQ